MVSALLPSLSAASARGAGFHQLRQGFPMEPKRHDPSVDDGASLRRGREQPGPRILEELPSDRRIRRSAREGGPGASRLRGRVDSQRALHGGHRRRAGAGRGRRGRYRRRGRDHRKRSRGVYFAAWHFRPELHAELQPGPRDQPVEHRSRFGHTGGDGSDDLPSRILPAGFHDGHLIQRQPQQPAPELDAAVPALQSCTRFQVFLLVHAADPERVRIRRAAAVPGRGQE